MRDALSALCEALLLSRGERGSADVPSSTFALSWFVRSFPAWSDNADATRTYALAFDDGWSAFKRRAQNVLSLPEAKGRELEALDLALNGELTASDIATRLRARQEDEDLIPFPASRSTKVRLGAEKATPPIYTAENDVD
ncbi:hypothetical protein NS226_17835 [Aureimonas ureilytica]|uniref:Uncharacterized protein n=1 Tax=Aureimonas ureilytica TaxID=401562 RepID=A0A175R6M8_9HYPH|nr:hypothetical protein NS226_17835 [Aureimonas ureilytica]